MDIEEVREYCIAKNGVTESFPFDDTALVFKVCDKMFALLSIDDDAWLNLKCEPEKAIELREQFSEVTPGFHMNKKMWNTIQIKSALPHSLIYEWIDDSYKLVVAKLTKAQRAELLLNSQNNE
ncbi:MAG: MmcQ/YjbR family DNA-binding protein [Prevotellaceae bacterium]|jgi:predicted DNA-binding protein (MmcQ/YjbR family)|nr:MmcQ/YjbR family DNA-binding protein [Prevotellaceae bacterium]